MGVFPWAYWNLGRGGHFFWGRKFGMRVFLFEKKVLKKQFYIVARGFYTTWRFKNRCDIIA